MIGGAAIGQLVGISIKAKRKFFRDRLEEPFEMKWDAEGISVNKSDQTYRFGWNDLAGIRQLKTHFLIFLTPTRMLIIPNRAFTDPSLLAHFNAKVLGRLRHCAVP